MRGSTQSGGTEQLLLELYERSGAAAYGLEPAQFTAIVAEIQKKYAPKASPEESVSFCAGLRVEELALSRACVAGN